MWQRIVFEQGGWWYLKQCTLNLYAMLKIKKRMRDISEGC